MNLSVVLLNDRDITSELVFIVTNIGYKIQEN